MSSLLQNAVYWPIHKWKQGEAFAHRTIKRSDQAVIQPIFVMPPAGDFDHEAGRVPDPVEHIRSFGLKVFKSRGRRPVFIDALHVDNERHFSGLEDHPLTVLIERARTAGAVVWPVSSLDRSERYQLAVRRFAQFDTRFPICLRLSASQFDSPDLGTQLDEFLAKVGCPPERVVMLLDLGPQEVSDTPSYAELLVSRINELPHLHRWLKLVVALTSFPEKMAMPAGTYREYPRQDWAVYEELVARRDQLIRLPMFGDYALEYPSYKVVGRVAPVAALRYSGPRAYIVAKGTTTRKPHGYKAIFKVAVELVAHIDFKGAAFSLGNAFMAELATLQERTGNASTWRWAATDHHLTLTLQCLRQLLGLAVPAPVEVPAEEQTDLFVVSTERKP